MNRLLRLLTLMALSLGLCPSVLAHKSSDAYVQLKRLDTGLSLRLDVALRDLDMPLDLDANGDARITAGEVKAAWPAIESYALARLSLEGCSLSVTNRGLERRTDGAYAVLWMESSCKPQAAPAIRYTLLREFDPTHRGLLKLEWGEQPMVLKVLDPNRPDDLAAAVAQAAPGEAAHVSGGDPTTTSTAKEGTGGVSSATEMPRAAPVPSFLGEGIHHIITGYDHVLFLMCLLLPSVMRRTPSGWQPVDGVAQAVMPVVGIVTAFTVAHSITLALAALKWVSLPPSFIEPAIAVTIVLAALDNLLPIFRGRRVLVTFLFGLIHGFGFAGVLSELDLPTTQFAWALLRFNVGLELGQLSIVVVAAGGLYLLRRRHRYPAWAIRGGSFAAIVVGVLWFIERTADVSLLGWQ